MHWRRFDSRTVSAIEVRQLFRIHRLKCSCPRLNGLIEAVVKDFRSAEHTLFGGLLARCWHEIRERGYQNLCGTASGPRLARYQQFGLPLHILGPSRSYWGEDRYPVFLSGEQFADFVQVAGLHRFRTTETAAWRVARGTVRARDARGTDPGPNGIII